ncbi:MAG: hypothetical protein IJW92_01650 [Clostridia bacterium]|nr:hypothetical protein [Clostridia bacterium]
MENNQQKEPFHYTYSANQQKEVEAIRKKYLTQEEDKMEQLRKLDASTTRTGSTVALIFGVIGCIVLGIGMCCTMVWGETLFFLGVIIGLIGILMVSLAYPLYVAVVRRARRKIAPEIIRLSDELMK